MDINGIGFSNVRLPNNSSSYLYTYYPNVNTFPEEVFIHEFLHSLERTLKEYNYNIPELHDYEKYGYKEQKLIGLKNWYGAYMACNIDDGTGKKIGLNPIVYKLKPSHESNFKYTIETDLCNDPQNIIEEIKSIFNVIIRVITLQKN